MIERQGKGGEKEGNKERKREGKNSTLVEDRLTGVGEDVEGVGEICWE